MNSYDEQGLPMGFGDILGGPVVSDDPSMSSESDGDMVEDIEHDNQSLMEGDGPSIPDDRLPARETAPRFVFTDNQRETMEKTFIGTTKFLDRPRTNTVCIVEEGAEAPNDGLRLVLTEGVPKPTNLVATLSPKRLEDILQKYHTSQFRECTMQSEWPLIQQLTKHKTWAESKMSFDQNAVMTDEEFKEFMESRTTDEERFVGELVYVRKAEVILHAKDGAFKIGGVSGGVGAAEDACWRPAIVIQKVEFETSSTTPARKGYSVQVFSNDLERPVVASVYSENDIRFLVRECNALTTMRGPLDPDTMHILPMVGANLIPCYAVLNTLHESSDTTHKAEFVQLAKTLAFIRGPGRPTVGDLGLYMVNSIKTSGNHYGVNLPDFVKAVRVVNSVVMELNSGGGICSTKKWNILQRLTPSLETDSD